MSWILVLELLGAAQGVFLAGLLVGRQENSLPNALLAALMGALSLELLSGAYHDAGLDVAYPHFIGVTFPLPFLYAPFFYLYAETLSIGRARLAPRQYLHFLPFVVAVLLMVPFFALSGPEKIATLEHPETAGWTPALVFMNHLKFPYSLAYVTGMLIVIRRHRVRVRDNLSYLDNVNLAWLRNLTIGGLLVWVVSFVSYLIGLSGQATEGPVDPIVGFDDYVLLAAAVFVYTIGFLGLRQPEIFSPERFGELGARSVETALNESLSGQPTDQSSVGSRYSKSGLSEHDARALRAELVRLMEDEQPYRDSGLALPDLAARLGTTTHNLSQAINSQTGSSFYDFVNSYRVEEVKTRLQDPASTNLTILSIGLDAGFNSKSAFNSVFKRQTGVSPSEFRLSNSLPESK